MQKGHTHYQWLVAIIASSTAFTYGLQAGWVSPMTKILKSEDSPIGEPLTDYHIGIIASLFCLSPAFSTLIYSYLADAYGRKVALLAVAVPQAIGWIAKMVSPNFICLTLSRVICGIASGGVFIVPVMYINEISQEDIRGKLVALVTFFQNIGFLVMYSLGLYLSYNTVMFITVSVPILNAICFLKTPESPAYLVKVGKIQEAKSTLAFLRGLEKDSLVIQNEVEALGNENNNKKSTEVLSYCDIFANKTYVRTFLLVVSLMAAQSINGVFAVLTYASTIMELCGVTFSPELQTLSFPVVLILGSFTAIVCVERFGRKPLLAIALFASVLALSGLGGTLMATASGAKPPAWLPVVTIVLAVYAYSSGVNSVPPVLMSEMFNVQIRAKLIGITVTISWTCAFIQLVVFSPVSQALGLHVMFFLFAGVNLFGAVVTLVFLPETKGKSIEELERILKTK